MGCCSSKTKPPPQTPPPLPKSSGRQRGGSQPQENHKQTQSTNPVGSQGTSTAGISSPNASHLRSEVERSTSVRTTRSRRAREHPPPKDVPPPVPSPYPSIIPPTTLEPLTAGNESPRMPPVTTRPIEQEDSGSSTSASLRQVAAPATINHGQYVRTGPIVSIARQQNPSPSSGTPPSSRSADGHRNDADVAQAVGVQSAVSDAPSESTPSTVSSNATERPAQAIASAGSSDSRTLLGATRVDPEPPGRAFLPVVRVPARESPSSCGTNAASTDLEASTPPLQPQTEGSHVVGTSINLVNTLFSHGASHLPDIVHSSLHQDSPTQSVDTYRDVTTTSNTTSNTTATTASVMDPDNQGNAMEEASNPTHTASVAHQTIAPPTPLDQASTVPDTATPSVQLNVQADLSQILGSPLACPRSAQPTLPKVPAWGTGKSWAQVVKDKGTQKNGSGAPHPRAARPPVAVKQDRTPVSRRPGAISPSTQQPSGSDLTADPRIGVLDYTDKLINLQTIPAGGGYCTLYRGQLRERPIGVAIKVLRLPGAQPGKTSDTPAERLRKRFYRELNIWKGLKHNRILPLFGYAYVKAEPAFISPFCSNGNAAQYLSNHPDADRERIILHSAEALMYLHSRSPNPVVHGDLKPANILIKQDGSAVLCDFGTSKKFGDESTQWITSQDVASTAAYASPQLNDNQLPTVQCDVFSFGWVIVELLTSRSPYYWANGLNVVLNFIYKRVMPTAEHYPTIHSDSPIWDLVYSCLQYEPEDRPNTEELYGRLLALHDALNDAVAAVRLELGQ